MSELSNATSATAGGASGSREFAEVKANANVKFLKPKDLTTLIGTFLAIRDSEYGPNYEFEQEDGAIVVVNGCGALNAAMKNVTTGSLVKLENKGKTPITTGKNKGKTFHDIKVSVAKG